jgi:hypothetical protein
MQNPRRSKDILFSSVFDGRQKRGRHSVIR